MGGNLVKITVLLTGLTLLFLFAGRILGGTQGILIAFGLAIIMNLGSYWFSDKIVLGMSNAYPITREQAPDIYQIVEMLAQRAHMPMPKVYAVDSAVPNAFATGRSPDTAVIAVTTGITRLLNRDELAGVIAHELAHVQHRDTLVSAVVATLAGAIGLVAELARWGFFLGGYSQDGERRSGNGIVGLVLLLIAPVIAALIRFGISRAHEFNADEGGAKLLGDPLALASALEKIEWAVHQRTMNVNPGVAALYIVNPLNGISLAELFSTHPPTSERIARLRALAAQQPQRVYALGA